MKTLKLSLKPIAYLLAFLILFQGCTVYKSANVTLDQAVIANTGVRIKTNDNHALRFKSIQHETGIYYGLKHYNKNWVKIPINEDNIDKVQIKDKTSSTILTIAIPLSVIGVPLGILVLSDPYLR
jgi:hypothetical protein